MALELHFIIFSYSEQQMKHFRQPSEMKKRRITMGITQESIAKRLNMAISSVGGIERGENPAQKEAAEKIAEMLQTNTTHLFKNHTYLKNRFIVR